MKLSNIFSFDSCVNASTTVKCFPIKSFFDHPVNSNPLLLTNVILPVASVQTIASGEVSMMPLSFCSLSLNASSAFFLSVTSLAITNTTTLSSTLLTEAEPSKNISWPFLFLIRVLRVAGLPARAFAKALKSFGESLDETTPTRVKCFPNSSFFGPPNTCTAFLLASRILPDLSKYIIQSLALSKVSLNFSSDFLRASSACLRTAYSSASSKALEMCWARFFTEGTKCSARVVEDMARTPLIFPCRFSGVRMAGLFS